ncbi:MAG: hypothetical protein ABIK28_12330, partial [Planctomycetota bacterium]
LKEEDRRLRSDGGQGIQAFGVVGTDLYDKQLALQALRGEFPHALFFTTDLDARLFHPSQYHWSRNLLIASAFDLRLSGKYQEEAPPFRDSYQTAAFLATTLALGASLDPSRRESKPEEDAGEITRYLSPRMFEIARSGAFDITPATYIFDDPGHLHPEKPGSMGKSRMGFHLILIFGLAFYFVTSTVFGSIVSLWRTLDTRLWRILLVVVPPIMLLITCVGVSSFLCGSDSPGNDLEPHVLFEGISIWPTEAMRLLVALLSLSGMVYGAAQIALSNRQLKEEYGLPDPTPEDAKKFGIWKGLGYILGLRPELKKNSKTNVNKAWLLYRINGHLRRTVLRVSVMLVVYILLTITIFRCWGSPAVPYRGEAAHSADSFVLFLSVVSLTLLILFVVDATRGCANFVRSLSDQETVWDVTTVSQFAEERKMSPRDVSELMDVEVIAKRTQTIGGLIIIPFLGLFLMILSRNHYFDQWDLPPELIAVLSIQSLIALLCAVRLRRIAEKARANALGRLSIRLTMELGSRTREISGTARQIQYLMEQIRDFRKGAFSPWFQNPVVRAFLMPFGGIGALALIDTLVKIGI